MKPAIIDTIQAVDGTLVANGSVAEKLMQTGFNINALRTNDVLRKDEWVQMDQILIDVARKRLVAVGTLIAQGLRFDIGGGLGTTILEWERNTDMEPANISMSGVTEGENDTLQFDLQSMPLPIIHKDFNINIRKLQASRTTGQSLDMAQIEIASTLVSEAIEEMVFIGNATRVGTSQIFGLLNQPDRNTGSVTANWDTVGTTGAQKLTDVQAMIAALQVDNMYGPYVMYVPNTAFQNLNQDYTAEYAKSQMSRLLETPGLTDILPSKDVTAGSIVMHQVTRDVIDEVIALQPTIVQWDSKGGMVKNFKVMAIMIPRVRSTITLQSGVAHFS